MEFVRSLKGYDHLWAVRFPEKETDELTLLFRRWGDINYLLDFLGTIWKTMELTREKARNWNRERHASWLRVYAIRLEKNVFVITGYSGFDPEVSTITKDGGLTPNVDYSAYPKSRQFVIGLNLNF